MDRRKPSQDGAYENTDPKQGDAAPDAGLWEFDADCAPLLEQMRDAVVILQDGVCKYANGAVAKMVGYEAEEIVGRPFADFIAPESKESILDRYRKRMEGKPVPTLYEARLLRKDGTAFVAEISASIVGYGGRPADLGTGRDVTERKKAEEEVRKQAHDLGERVKEMDCLYGISRLVETAQGSLDEILQGTVGLIPPAWQYPEITSARITLEGREFTTTNFSETVWKQTSDITVRGNRTGTVEVCYLEERPQSDEGPFLKEESYLIDAVAERLGRITERKRAEERIEHLNLVLRAIRNVNQLIAKEKDRDKLLQGVCDSLIETRGYHSAWVALLDDTGGLVATAEAGLGDDFLLVLARLQRGELPACGRRALTQQEIVVTHDPPSACPDCPLADKHAGRGAMTVRLEHGGKVYGFASVSFPAAVLAAEEEDLFGEVAGDIAFALHAIELDEERKRAEDALQHERDLMQTLYDNHPDFIFFKDVEARYYRPNRRICEFLGRNMEDIIGRTDLDLFSGEISRQTYTEDLHVIKTGTPSINKEEIAETVFLTSKMPWFDREGNIIGLFGISRDITERKQAEQALWESEERYRLLAENVTDVIFTMGLDMRYTYVSPSVTRLRGFSVEEVMAGTIEDTLPPHSLEKARKMLTEELAEERKQKDPSRSRTIELEMNCKDGAPVWTEVKLSLARDTDGQAIGLQGVTRDITERKRTEDALRESEEKYRLLFEGYGDPVGVYDTEGRVLLINEVGANNLDALPEDLVGKPMHELLPERAEAHVERIRQVVNSGKSEDFEDMVRLPSGERWFWAGFQPVKGESGKVVAVQIVNHDITERKQMEEELQRIDKLESVGTLAGGIAHDFNNLLTGIVGNVGLAKNYVGSKSEAYEVLLEAERASLRAKNLTQQLLTFAKGSAPVKELASIHNVVVDSATFALRGSNVRCQFDLPDDLWQAEVDVGQISQVLNNLVINADEAMPAGGTIHIGAKNRVIGEKTALPLKKGNYVEITLQDQGIGISREHLGKIFDPYFTTKQKGSGLGLASAYSIVKDHEGHITAESELGTGTTFHIYLPATKKRIRDKKQEAAKQTGLWAKGRILVMDDEEMIRKMLRKILPLAGYEVEVASDGAEAIELYAKARESGQPFDAVILDLTVPGGMGGRETIKKLLEIDPDVKAIVSSGYSTDTIMSDFREYGFSAVAAKPYSIEALEETLGEIMAEKKAP